MAAETVSDGDGANASQDRAAALLVMALENFAVPEAAEGIPVVEGFEIISRLGAGASGEVWLAEEVALGRTVALKILHDRGASEEVLQREFRILATLVHPNLVLLYHGIATTDGRQGLAMEWIDGWPLDEWLEEHPDLSLVHRLELFSGLVRGVAFLHDHGVIHRDLKPANVIVNSQGVARIVDFGLARYQLEAVSAKDGGSIGALGTLHFMAPEQAANGKGARAMPVDVYALGLMLHRILTETWFYPKEGTPAETLAMVLHPPPLDLHAWRRSLPRDLLSILRQSLAPDPVNRYHHARELEADLDRFAAKLPVAARKHTVAYLAITCLRRQARRSAVAAVVVIAGLAVGGTLTFRHRAMTARNEANLRHAHALTSFTLRQLRDELRTGSREEGGAPLARRADLSGAGDGSAPVLPINADGELDLRYYQAVLADVRSATSENHERYGPALKSIQPALDLYCKLSHESPNDPKRLLDAAQARLSFARLLGKIGRADAAGMEARKTLQQLDRLATWPGFDPVSLPPMRCDALRLLARQAHLAGDSDTALRLGGEMLAVCETLPAGLLVRPENETIPRLALAASDLATYAIAAGPSRMPEARLKIDRATERCRAAHQQQPSSFALACGLARCLHASARLSLQDGEPTDLQPLLEETTRLLIGSAADNSRAALPLIWEVAVTATGWAETLQDHPDEQVPRAALVLAQRLTVHVRRNGDTRDEVLMQRARLFLHQSRQACRFQNRREGARFASLACGLLLPRQMSNPDKVPLALQTAAVLHHARGLADLPEMRWTEAHGRQLDELTAQLMRKVDHLTPQQQQELAGYR